MRAVVIERSSATFARWGINLTPAIAGATDPTHLKLHDNDRCIAFFRSKGETILFLRDLTLLCARFGSCPFAVIACHRPVRAGPFAVCFFVMAFAAPHHAYTYEEFLALEAAANVKHEFLDGEMYAMAGGSLDHGALALVVGSLLRAQFTGRPCRVFNSDVRVLIQATGLVTYPDLSIVCGPVERDPRSRVTLVNPVGLVEVLSDSTQAYDQGEKFEHYRQMASLRAYVLVDAHTPAIEARQRPGENDSWTITQCGPGQSIRLPSLDAILAVDEVYRDGLLGA